VCPVECQEQDSPYEEAKGLVKLSLNRSDMVCGSANLVSGGNGMSSVQIKVAGKYDHQQRASLVEINNDLKDFLVDDSEIPKESQAITCGRTALFEIYYHHCRNRDAEMVTETVTAVKQHIMLYKSRIKAIDTRKCSLQAAKEKLTKLDDREVQNLEERRKVQEKVQEKFQEAQEAWHALMSTFMRLI
jgi:hypothetical protein